MADRPTCAVSPFTAEQSPCLAFLDAGRGGSVVQPFGLILDLDGQVLELGQVLAAVVRAEEQLAP